MKTERPTLLQMGVDITIPSNGTTAVMTLIHDSLYLNNNYDIKSIYFAFPTLTKILKIKGALKALFKFFSVIPKVDLVHIHHSTGFNLFMTMIFTWLSTFFGKTVILHNHAGDFLQYYHNKSRLTQLFINKFLSLPDIVIILSERFKKSYISTFDGSTTWLVLRNPSPLEIPSSPNRVKTSNLNILYMNRLHERKGIFDLLDIVPQLIKIKTNITFLIAGDGDMDQVTRAVRLSGLKENILLLGWISGPTKIDVLRNTDIFVLPSYHEALPMALLESMTFGIASVVTDVGGIPEIVSDGENGLLVKPGDKKGLANAISRLAQNDQLRAEIGRAAYTTIKNSYSADNYIHTLSDLYKSLLNNATRHLLSAS